MMQMCSDGHDEIVYDGHKCPLCAANEEIGDLKSECAKLEKEVESLNEEIASLQ